MGWKIGRSANGPWGGVSGPIAELGGRKRAEHPCAGEALGPLAGAHPYDYRGSAGVRLAAPAAEPAGRRQTKLKTGPVITVVPIAIKTSIV